MAYDCKDYVNRLLEPHSYSKHWTEEKILSFIKQIQNLPVGAKLKTTVSLRWFINMFAPAIIIKQPLTDDNLLFHPIDNTTA